MSGGFVRACAAVARHARARVRFALALLTILACATPALADGAASWTFEVLDFSQVGDNEHLIRLKPSPPGKKFPRSCETFVVRARFALDDWSAAARGRYGRIGHERSLRLLEQAQVTHDIVRIASIGLGFGSIPERPRCEVMSHALQLRIDRAGTSVVYSLYEEPRRPGFGPPMQ
jgi:hypothetical protein